MRYSRTTFLTAPAAIAAESSDAKKEEKKKKNDDKKKASQLPIPAKGERYIRLPTIVLELWDRDGNFRMSSVDLLLLDLRLSDSEGFAGLAGVRSDFPTVPVVVVSASEDGATITRALAFGAAGFIPKSASLAEMIEALTAIRAGETWAPPTAGVAEVEPMEARIASLTPSQLRILIGLQEGRLNKQIAFDLGVTEATIKAHLTGVFRKLGVQNRTQAVIAARALSLEV